MKPSKKIEIVDKNDEVDEITNYLRGNYIKAKASHQSWERQLPLHFSLRWMV
jgi:hypothetical protein